MQLSPYLHALLTRIKNAGQSGHTLNQGEVSGALMLGIHRLATVQANCAHITPEGHRAIRWAA